MSVNHTAKVQKLKRALKNPVTIAVRIRRKTNPRLSLGAKMKSRAHGLNPKRANLKMGAGRMKRALKNQTDLKTRMASRARSVKHAIKPNMRKSIPAVNRAKAATRRTKPVPKTIQIRPNLLSQKSLISVTVKKLETEKHVRAQIKTLIIIPAAGETLKPRCAYQNSRSPIK